MPNKKPVILCILDGWGIGDGGEHDAIASANTPHWDQITKTYPSTTLTTFGPDVGLPEGQMGNSEVGHMNIGAGRVVKQFLPRISEAFAEGSINENEYLLPFIHTLKKSGAACHLMGLASDGGVHADIKHIMKMATILNDHGVPVKIHAFTDGRDTSPQSAKGYLKTLQDHCDTLDKTEIVTLSGRYYAMDRDKRWDRVQKAFAAAANGQGPTAPNAAQAIQNNYDLNVTDEFIAPTVLGGYTGIQNNDGILFANFRSDRARELLQALLDPTFEGFDRGDYAPLNRLALGMVPYSDEIDPLMATLFPPPVIPNNLGETLAKAGKHQLRMAETEKYPHVTFFFNSGVEAPNEDEARILAPSPKVATYDLQPEMSAAELTEKLLKAINTNEYDAIIINYANPDMVGHTGSIEAARKACETVDKALGQIEPLVIEKGGVLLLTADHGNADQMWNAEKNEPHTAHTLNPVPFIVIGAGDVKLQKGRLADIAPTMLEFLNIEKPIEMTGQDLVIK